jgi:hypothetical protein
MANGYKKNSSNPYKKAEEVQKKAPGSRPVERAAPAPVEQPVEAPKVEEKQVVVIPAVEEKPVEPVKENVIVETEIKKNLLAGMIEQKPKAKSNSFYLDDEVVAALEKLAKQNKSNKSKVLNTLLRNILLDNN